METNKKTFVQETSDNKELTQIRRTINYYSMIGLIIVVLFFGGSLIWSILASLEGAVIAQGVVVVQKNQQKIQHPSGGVIKKINIREGDFVKKNEILFEIDDTSARANSKIINDQITQLRIQKIRLEAERDGLDSIKQNEDFPVDQDQLIQREILYFEIRKKSIEGQIAQNRERISQLRSEIGGLKLVSEAKIGEYEILTGELDILDGLLQKNLIPQSKYSEANKSHFRLKSEIAQIASQIYSSQGKIQEYEIMIENLKTEFLKDVNNSLRESNSKLIELYEKKLAADQVLENTTIKSPIDGYIHQLNIHTIGGVIQPGEILTVVIPKDDDLIIEGKISPNDISSVKIDGLAYLKFPSFDRHTTPEILGKIILVSPDLVQVGSSLNQQQQGQYFVVRLSVSKEEILKLNNKDLRPGLPVEIFIVTEKRSAFVYLINPILEQFSRTFREQ